MEVLVLICYIVGIAGLFTLLKQTLGIAEKLLVMYLASMDTCTCRWPEHRDKCLMHNSSDVTLSHEEESYELY